MIGLFCPWANLHSVATRAGQPAVALPSPWMTTVCRGADPEIYAGLGYTSRDLFR
jgi:hypothetical protein